MILKEAKLVLIATIFLAAFNNLSFSQTIKPTRLFSNTWLIKPYYEKLVETDSLYHAFNDSFYFTRLIYISPNIDSLIVSSLNEGNLEAFEVKSENELHVAKTQFGNSPYTIFLTTAENKTLLALIEDAKVDTVFYVPLEDKYKVVNGFHKFINDKFFTGTYISEDSKYKITFHANGQLEGFHNYNEYRVDVFFSGFIRHDLVYFHDIQRIDIDELLRQKVVGYKSFNWRKVGKDIWLYNLSDKHGFGEVTTLFTKLKKVD